MRYPLRALAACLALGISSSVAAQTPAPAIALLPASAPLADRIQNAVDRYQSSGERPALEELKALVDEAGRTPKLDPGLRADLYTIYAYTLARAKQGDEAIRVIRQAEADYAAAGLGADSKMGDLLLAEAVFQDFVGDTTGALATRYRAQDVYVKAKGEGSPEAARIRAQIAFSLFAQGKLKDALTTYADALPMIADDADSVRVYAMQMSNYALALRLAGDLDQSLDTSQKALEVARAKLPAGHPAALSAMANMGITLMEMGRYEEAETILREAVDQSRQYRGRNSIETVGNTYRLAQVLEREGHAEEAQVLLSAALEGLEGVNTGPNPDLPGLIRLELAQIAIDGDDNAGARTHLEAGIAAIADTGHVGDMTRARLQTRLAEVLLVSGDLTGARTQVELALPYYAAELPDYAPDRIRAGMLHALILTRSGHVAEGLALGTQIASAMKAHLDTSGIGRREQADLAASYQLNFTRFTDIALTADQPEQAFEAAQLAGLSEVAATSQAIAARAAARDSRAADMARSLQTAQVNRLRLDRERTFALGKSDDDVIRLDGEIAALDVDLKTMAGDLAEVFPEFAILSQPHPVSLAEAQAGLAHRQAIFMPLLSDDRVIVLTLTQKGLSWDSAPLSRSRAVSDVHSLRLAVQPSRAAALSFNRAPAWQLGQALFTPKIRAALKDSNELEIVGSGPLMTLAFGALLTEAPQGRDDDPDALRNSAWLIRSYALSVKPALLARGDAKPPQTQGFLGVGAPVLGPAEPDTYAGLTTAVWRGSEKDAHGDVDALRQMPSLPLAGNELARMNQAFAMPGSVLITGADATEARVRTLDMSGYSVIAFATHGLISGNLESLREPALVLTPPATPSEDDDGLLTASDVAGLRINARWVILSACNTGSGREDGAAGYSGLAQAFMQAGAQSLLVSLWPVRDDVADRLSVDTVRRNVKGVSQPQALRGAILSLIDDRSVQGGSNPAIWAPFSLVVR